MSFFLGFACGAAVLPITAYRHVSPVWLRILLIATGLGMMSRYASMALFADSMAGQPARIVWYSGYAAIVLPAVFAVDQLLRHPAMTPRKLLIGLLPFLLVYAVAVLIGRPKLILVVQCLLSALFATGCVYFIRKIPVRPIRTALGLLAFALGCLGISPLIADAPLFPEMFVLFCVWYAFETALAQQR